MKELFLFLVLSCFAFGCATNSEYNALTSAEKQTFLLNESSFAQMTIGMKQQQVHEIMGDAIVIGYSYDQANQSKPMTIANPYKKEDLSRYTVEYYVTRVNQSDGIISDDELMPLVFREGILVGKGWDYLKSLRLKNP